MNITILGLVVTLLTGGPQTPNFYSGFTTAREASKKSGKEMVVFFSDKGCGSCESAWSAFEQDQAATQQFISTRMNADNFDGGIYFDLLGLTTVPSWVILNPDGTEKTRWEGGWKDSNGNPTLFDKNVQTVAKQETKMEVPEKRLAPMAVDKQKSPIEASSAAPPSAASVSTNTPNSTITGYVIQAGYFGSEENAKKLVTDLHSKGFDSFSITTLQQNDKMYYRVISKIFTAETDAEKENIRMTSAGIKVSIRKTSEL